MRLVILLSTELPRPSGPSQLAASLRREVVHRLASAAATRSELAECAELTLCPKAVRGEVIEAVLAGVADKKSAPLSISLGAVGQSRAPKYELRQEVYGEYDPDF